MHFPTYAGNHSGLRDSVRLNPPAEPPVVLRRGAVRIVRSHESRALFVILVPSGPAGWILKSSSPSGKSSSWRRSWTKSSAAVKALARSSSPVSIRCSPNACRTKCSTEQILALPTSREHRPTTQRWRTCSGVESEVRGKITCSALLALESRLIMRGHRRAGEYPERSSPGSLPSLDIACRHCG